jgi:hypothetical protein
MSREFQALLQDLATHVGIADAEGLLASSQLVIDGVTVSLLFEDEIARDNVVCYADLGAAPLDRANDVYRHLLEANLLWAGTGGATLGLHPDTAHVFLSYKLPIQGLNGEGLATALDQFTSIALFWTSFVAGTQGIAANTMPAGATRA